MLVTDFHVHVHMYIKSIIVKEGREYQTCIYVALNVCGESHTQLEC